MKTEVGFGGFSVSTLEDRLREVHHFSFTNGLGYEQGPAAFVWFSEPFSNVLNDYLATMQKCSKVRENDTHAFDFRDSLLVTLREWTEVERSEIRGAVLRAIGRDWGAWSDAEFENLVILEKELSVLWARPYYVPVAFKNNVFFQDNNAYVNH